MPYNLLGGQYLNPIIIGVVDEIESHGGIFETYPAVFLVILADCIIVSGHAEAEMAFVLAQFVGLGMFFQAGQFQKKTRAAVGEVDQRGKSRPTTLSDDVPSVPMLVRRKRCCVPGW